MEQYHLGSCLISSCNSLFHMKHSGSLRSLIFLLFHVKQSDRVLLLSKSLDVSHETLPSRFAPQFHIAVSHEALMITLWFSILFTLFHVKQSDTYSCSVALLMFHMKHCQAGTPSPNFISLFHMKHSWSRWDFLSVHIVHVKQSDTYPCSVALLMFHMIQYQAGMFLPLPFTSLVTWNTNSHAGILYSHHNFPCETIQHVRLLNNAPDVSHDTLPSRYDPLTTFHIAVPFETLLVSLRISNRTSEFHVKQYNMCHFSVSLLMFHTKHHQASTSLPTFRISAYMKYS